MRIVVTGARGQLGRSLQRALAKHDCVPVDLPDCDVADPAAVDCLAAFEPELVIHAAAMTDVDGCERDPEAAFRVNALGTQHVALACQRAGCPMLYVSTDYVFDGAKGEPYWEFDEPNPLSVYGASKLAGERYVQTLLNRFYIVRTAWLYGPGGRNFVAKVLELGRTREELAFVTNEVGSPTYAPDLAEAIARLIQHPLYGVYHLVNEGACSRFEFARAILELGGLGHVRLRPIEHYPRLARPPAYAPLRNFCAATQLGIVLRPWKEGLQAYFEENTGAQD